MSVKSSVIIVMIKTQAMYVGSFFDFSCSPKILAVESCFCQLAEGWKKASIKVGKVYKK
jgi:hypothetical protein